MKNLFYGALAALVFFGAVIITEKTNFGPKVFNSISFSPIQAEVKSKASKAVKPVAVKTEAVKTEVIEPVTAQSQVPDLEKGKRLYISNCIKCHNKDPNIKGSIGPEMVDAPLEVMYAKVMTGRYPEVLPPGFVPKRKSKAMMKIPKLKNDIPSIWAYVQSLKRSKK